ncbi:SRPBCC family protein [Terrarubrum flagellatum]|uniref:SRPBCC family protein n=1 Tax=Terrirubrum flagellatum TaxID=2895980 RepID=UPI003144F109
MAGDRFVYVVYIKTTAEKLWRALIEPEFTRQYWVQSAQESTWEIGSSWRLVDPDGRLCDAGEVLEFDPPRRLAVSWRNELFPEAKAEGFSRMSYDLEPRSDAVKLTVIHEIDKPKSELIAKVSNGWPAILSSLKSLLETGEALEETRRWPKRL